MESDHKTVACKLYTYAFCIPVVQLCVLLAGFSEAETSVSGASNELGDWLIDWLSTRKINKLGEWLSTRFFSVGYLSNGGRERKRDLTQR